MANQWTREHTEKEIAWYTRGRDKSKDALRALKYPIAKYGITTDQYFKLLEKQGGACAICFRPPKVRRLHVDHDHKTGRVRGLLCFPCNYKFLNRSASASKFRRAADYLESDFDARAL